MIPASVWYCISFSQIKLLAKKSKGLLIKTCFVESVMLNILINTDLIFGVNIYTNPSVCTAHKYKMFATKSRLNASHLHSLPFTHNIPIGTLLCQFVSCCNNWLPADPIGTLLNLLVPRSANCYPIEPIGTQLNQLGRRWTNWYPVEPIGTLLY